MKLTLDKIHIRDPFILPDNKKYYLYGTRGSANFGEAYGFDVYVSDDLEYWDGPTEIFKASENFWGTENFWAPEVHKYRGRYYMLATFKSDKACRATQIFVSDTPVGPFRPISDGPVTPREWECLDGTLYISKGGKPYMVFCREWLQVADGEIYAVPLTEDLKETAGEPILLIKASQPKWADKNRKNYITDGPFLYRTEDGNLLMLWSSIARGSYVEAVAYSDNGEITGNWEHCDKPLFKCDGGHGMIFEDFNTEKYFVCHSPNVPPNEHPILKKIEECKSAGGKECDSFFILPSD